MSVALRMSQDPSPEFPDYMASIIPVVQGRLTANYDMSRIAWFRVGGTAEVLFRPHDVPDLVNFLTRLPSDVPVTVVGVASNLLVRDGGIPGVTIRLGRAFAEMHVLDDRIIVGSAALDIHVARTAADYQREGCEFLSGIPGTIGGALRMNAGAYGREISDLVLDVTAVDRQGHVHAVMAQDMGFAYRHCAAPEGWIFTQATLRGDKGNLDKIQAEMQRIAHSRQDSQPIRSRTGGSTFANPEGKKAWELIDHAGCRGLRHGGAMVSEQHCNFLINTGTATAADIETLGETVRQRVQRACGIQLHWEIRRVGVHATGSMGGET